MTDIMLNRELRAAPPKEKNMGNYNAIALARPGCPENFEKYVNMDEGLMRMAGKTSLYKTIMKSFLANEDSVKLEEQAKAGNLEDAAKTAHGIKGMVGNIALPLLFDRSRTLESDYKEGVYDEQKLADFVDVMATTKANVTWLLTEIDAGSFD